MKVLSVRNPWAWLILHGKDVENRTWRTKYRGKLGIHASKVWEKGFKNPSSFFTLPQWESMSEEYKRILIFASQSKIPCSAIIGEVDLVDVTFKKDSIWSVNGQYQWVFENPVFYGENFIPDVKGKLGIWEFDDSLINRQMIHSNE